MGAQSGRDCGGTMRASRIDSIKWLLKEEGLKDVLKQFSHKEGERRTYTVYKYKDGRIFIKSFLEKGLGGLLRNIFIPRGKREYELGEKLSSLGVLTPVVLGYGTSRRGSYVIQEWIEGESLIRQLEKTGEREKLFVGLADLLKILKSNYIRHNDLHLDNILVLDNKLYLIDLHKMRIKRSFNVRDEISNLSHALTMVYSDMTGTEKDTFFRNYGDEAIRHRLEEEIERLRRNWVRRKRKRAFKDTSITVYSDEYLYVRGMEKKAKGGFVANLKEDKKVKVERFSDHIRKIYCNRRRLRNAWKNHVALAYMHLSIIPQAYYLKTPSLLKAGYIAMEDLGGRGEELDRYLDRRYDSMKYNERKRFVEKLSGFFEMIFRKGILHKDMKGCNLFALEDGSFALLDVEDIVFRDIDEETLKKILIQLNNAVPKRISINDRMRFFLRLTGFMKVDRKRIFKYVRKGSLKGEIVYEGAGGLKVESW